VTLFTTASAGNGVGAGSGGDADARGSATAARTATVNTYANGGTGATAGQADASATAATTATAGTASANARATSVAGTANATAVTNGIDAADLTSYAWANGAAGLATARSIVTSGSSSIEARADADVKTTTVSQASASYNPAAGLTFPNLNGGSNGMQAFSFANGAPNAAALNTLLGAHPEVAAAVGSGVVIGLGSLGANYTGGTGTRTYTASALYSFNLNAATDLTLGLLDMSAYNGGFDTLNFKVKRGGTTVLNANFAALADAQAYFTDKAKTLSGFVVGNNTVLLTYTLTASANKGSDISYLLSRPGGTALWTPPASAAERQAQLTENWAAAYKAMADLRQQAGVAAGLQPSMSGSTLASGSAPRAPGSVAAGSSRVASESRMDQRGRTMQP
jgi:hypothetical protein